MTTLEAVPSHFYRYSGAKHLDWLKDILLKHRLYFPTLPELNDPVEGRPRIINAPDHEFAKFLFRVWRLNHPQAALLEIADNYHQICGGIAVHGAEKLYREMTLDFHNALMGMRVFSMSKRWDNLALWAKYADDHHGYCLEFANEGAISVAREVEYCDAVTIDVTRPDAVEAHFLWQKRMDWSNEEEVRIVAPRTTAANVPIEATLLSKVILGKDMASAHRAKVREWAATREPQVTVVQAEYDPMHQRLRVVP